MKTEHFKRLIQVIAALVFSVLHIAPSMGQALTSLCVVKDRNQGGVTVQDCIPVGTQSGQTALPVSASVSVNASITGFNSETVLTPITATTGGVTSSAFTAGKTVIVSNTGTTNTAYCRLGNASSASAQPILPGSWFAFSSIAETTFTCSTSTGTTTVNAVVGTGLATGAGGGSGSGGGGGVVTQGTDPWLVAGKGTAGTPSGGVVSVQGVAGGTPAPISGAVTATLAAETTKVIGTVNQGTSPWVVSGTVTANQGGSPWGMNLTQLGGNAINLGTGATGTGTIRTVTASDDPLLTTASTYLAATTRTTNTYTNAAVSPLNGNLNGALYVENSPSGGAGTDCGVTVTTGGTAQNFFTGVTGVQQVFIMDIDTGKTEGIWISFTGTAAPNTVGSFYIPPYNATSGAGSFTLPPGAHPTAISVYAATTGHKVSCTRF